MFPAWNCNLFPCEQVSRWSIFSQYIVWFRQWCKHSLIVCLRGDGDWSSHSSTLFQRKMAKGETTRGTRGNDKRLRRGVKQTSWEEGHKQKSRSSLSAWLCSTQMRNTSFLVTHYFSQSLVKFFLKRFYFVSMESLKKDFIDIQDKDKLVILI